jgi:dTDP-4-amino-4,6-dideoxygalactose transaminase
MKPRVIPFHRPSIGEAEIVAVAAVMRSGWLTTGPVTAEFESQLAEYVGAPYAVAVNSCTSGLQLALTALGIGPGDEVITSPMTFCATVLAILHTGATPILADVGADGNLDSASVESRITIRTKALLPVHLGGNPCDMDALWGLANRHGLFVVEDAAHALGTQYDTARVGGNSRSDAVVFSFYATKTLTTGEGGMVTTHRADLSDRMRRLGYHGIGARNDWQYKVEDAGFKFNLSDMQSATGLEQLKRQEEFLAARVEYARIYDEELAGLEGVELSSKTASPGNCWHLYRLLVRGDRDRLIGEMKQRGVSCSVHFIPIPLHPFFAEAAVRTENYCPRALALYPQLVSLPIYPAMSADDVRYVAECVRAVVK